MEAAAQELLNRQQAKINDLIKQADKKSNIMLMVYQNNIEKVRAFDIPEDHTFFSGGFRDTVRSAKSARSVKSETSRIKTTRRIADKSMQLSSYRPGDFDSLSQSVRSPSSFREGIPKGHPIKGHHKSEIPGISRGKDSLSPIKRELSPEQPRELMMSPSQKELFQTYRKMTEKENELDQSRRFTQSAFTSPQQKGTQRVDTLNLTGKDLSMYAEGEKREGAESPLKEITGSSDKDRQINRLAKSLKQKIDEVIQIEDINKQLKEKLRAYQEQNEKNIKVAQEEIQAITLELEKSQMAQRDMEREIANLRKEMSEMMERYQKLESQKSELVDENVYYKQVEHEFHRMKTIEDKSDLAYKFYESKIMEKAFHLLRFGVRMSRRVEDFTQKVRQRASERLKLSTFRALQKAAIISKIIKYKESERAHAHLAHKFALWKMFASTEKVRRYNTLRKNHNLLAETFSALVLYKNIRKRKRLTLERIDAYYKGKLLREGLNAFKINWKLYGLPQRVETELEDQAIRHNLDWIARVAFFKWKKHVKEDLIPKRIRNRIAYVFYKKNLLTTGMRLLIANYNFYFEIKEKAEIMRQRRLFRLAGELFYVWKNDLKVVNQTIKEKKEKQVLYILRKKFDHWRNEFNVLQRMKAAEKKAIEHNKLRMTIKYFKRIIEFGIKSQNRKIVYKALKERMDGMLISSHFRHWQNTFNARIEERNRIMSENLALEDKYMAKWIRYTQHRRQKHRQERLAYKFFVKGIENQIARIFAEWKSYSFGRKRGRNIEILLEDKRKLKIYRNVFDVLKIRRIRRLKKKFFDLYKEFETLQSQMKKNLEYTNEADEERLKLINNIEALGNTVDSLKTELSITTKELQDTKGRLESSQDNVNRLTRNLDKTSEELQKVTAQLNQVTDALDRKNIEFNRQVEQNQNEKAKLVQTLQNLQSDVEQKQDIIQDLEKENRQLSDLLEKTNREDQLKINQLEGHIKQLKETVRVKDEEIKEASELIGRFEKSNLELKNKLAETIGELESSALRYQDTIQSLEIKNHSLIDDLKMVQKEKEIQAREIADLRETVRMFEAQLAQMAAAQHKDTEDFINTIHKGKLRTELNLSKREEYQSERKRAASPRGYLSLEGDHAPASHKETIPKSVVYSPKDGSPLRDFLTKRDRRAEELEATHERIQEEVNRKGSIKHQFLSPERVSFKPILKSPTRKSVMDTQDTSGQTSTKSPGFTLTFTTPIDDIKRDIEKLKSSKRTILENIELRNRTLRSSFKK